MTETNSGRNGRSGSFGDTVAMDLASGRAVDLAELYALDAVTEEERRAIEQYMSAAPAAERTEFFDRVRQARETLVRTFRVEEQPPADLFDRIVAQLPAQGGPDANTPAPPAPGQSAAGQFAPGQPVASQPASVQPGGGDELARARQRREERRRPGSTRRWLAGVAAAAAIALGGVGVGSYLADQNDPLNQVVRAGDLREASVDVAGGGTATLLISSSEDAAVVKMNGVPAPPAGKVYQMWLIPKDGSAPVSQGLMDEEALSKPAVVEGISSAAALGITVEPAGGSQSPTLPTVAAAPLGA
ncbi:anti-sigma-K factor RskA [Pseudarthrobacter oxydans]|uniref:Regulator of SigK n=1 Tax=Pseudarthrobacter oxydans TaxID=1671 RepID=A0AAW8N7E7_PSEOX|nr:anti-sigma factor [Pseudarthrobacter oxydans]MDR6792429.1 anti-sigma-K factor RskA [Pseudarthrobacter oxydans]MDR7162160.1 anti-sigma-K factor RskA [Pseudarthrobacter oxydans]NSX35910.1 anti-sigma factor [Pseudarthrobacter oxydans]